MTTRAKSQRLLAKDVREEQTAPVVVREEQTAPEEVREETMAPDPHNVWVRNREGKLVKLKSMFKHTGYCEAFKAGGRKWPVNNEIKLREPGEDEIWLDTVDCLMRYFSDRRLDLATMQSLQNPDDVDHLDPWAGGLGSTDIHGVWRREAREEVLALCNATEDLKSDAYDHDLEVLMNHVWSQKKHSKQVKTLRNANVVERDVEPSSRKRRRNDDVRHYEVRRRNPRRKVDQDEIRVGFVDQDGRHENAGYRDDCHGEAASDVLRLQRAKDPTRKHGHDDGPIDEPSVGRYEQRRQVARRSENQGQARVTSDDQDGQYPNNGLYDDVARQQDFDAGDDQHPHYCLDDDGRQQPVYGTSDDLGYGHPNQYPYNESGQPLPRGRAHGEPQEEPDYLQGAGYGHPVYARSNKSHQPLYGGRGYAGPQGTGYGHLAHGRRNQSHPPARRRENQGEPRADLDNFDGHHDDEWADTDDLGAQSYACVKLYSWTDEKRHPVPSNILIQVANGVEIIDLWQHAQVLERERQEATVRRRGAQTSICPGMSTPENFYLVCLNAWPDPQVVIEDESLWGCLDRVVGTWPARDERKRQGRTVPTMDVMLFDIRDFYTVDDRVRRRKQAFEGGQRTTQ